MTQVDSSGRDILVVPEGNRLRGTTGRVGQVGGELTWASGPSEGFHLEARIPVNGPVPGTRNT